MQTQLQNVEAVTTINYQFTAIPTNLFMVLDNNCRSTLFSLIQLSTYYAKEDGYFYRTNSDLEFQTNLSKNVINAALDALYINGIIDVIPSAKGQGKKQSGKYFKVNFESFLEFEKLSIEDAMKNEDYKIYTPNYKGTYTPSFNLEGKQQGKKVITTLVKSDNLDTNCNTTLVPTLVTTLVKSDNNINNIENKDNKNNIYNNINKNNINIYNNILEENSEEIGFGDNPISDNKGIENYEIIEEVGLINYPTSNEIEEINPMTNGNGSDNEDEVLDMIFGAEIIEENNIAFQHIEVGMQETKENNMNTSFEKNFNDLLNRLGDNCSSVEELEQKTIKLCGWVIKHQMDYNNEERQTIHNLIADKYDELKQTIETNIKEVNKAQDEFFNNINLDPTKAKTVNQVKKENESSVEQPKEITKEKLEKDINDFINSLPTYEDYSRATDTANYITKKFDKLIRQYGLMQLAMDMYTQIDAHKNANKSDLTNLNNQNIETTINDEKTQEIASCEVMDDSNIEDCIAALIEDLEPAVLDKEEILF